jgi:hypothetical protein
MPRETDRQRLPMTGTTRRRYRPLPPSCAGAAAAVAYWALRRLRAL